MHFVPLETVPFLSSADITSQNVQMVLCDLFCGGRSQTRMCYERLEGHVPLILYQFHKAAPVIVVTVEWSSRGRTCDKFSRLACEVPDEEFPRMLNQNIVGRQPGTRQKYCFEYCN